MKYLSMTLAETFQVKIMFSASDSYPPIQKQEGL